MLRSHQFDLNFKAIAFCFLSCVLVVILSLILLDISFIITVCFFSLSDQISQVHTGYQEVKSFTQAFFTTKITTVMSKQQHFIACTQFILF